MAIKVMHPKSEFEDERGGITPLIDQNKFALKTVLRITCKAGSIRSNHHHKKDSHYIYVESGKCEYSEKVANDPSAKLETVTLEAGDLVFTRPGVIHAVKSLEDTVLYAFTTQKRQHEQYEQDTERITIVE